jgi:hypothetical protein
MVRDTGFEPVTPTVSMWCSTTELTARTGKSASQAKSFLASLNFPKTPEFRAQEKSFFNFELAAPDCYACGHVSKVE